MIYGRFADSMAAPENDSLSVLRGPAMTRTFVVLSALAVAGCVTTDTTGTTRTTATTAKVDVMPSELQKSIAEYRACVDAKGRAKGCEAQRLAMEAEERAYFNRSSGTEGGTSASYVNIQSR
jgi:outer membrane murein-binding lipoprotein Lpp